MTGATPKTSEFLTRKQLIDRRLQDAGWKIVLQKDFDPGRPLTAYNRCAIEEYPTDNGPADYALVVNGQILGVVEAKKLTLGPQNVLIQAERYSKGVVASPFHFAGFRVPFLYATNGEVIWHHDVRHKLNRSRQIFGFHTPNALLELMSRDFDSACEKLLTMPNDHKMIRPYQQDANAATETAIAERKRAMLTAMATGTGKTYTEVNEIYRLMKSGVAKRVLFLVDRRALAAQAVKAFASFEAEPGLKFNQIYEVYHQQFHQDDLEDEEKWDPKVLPKGYLKDPKPGHAFVYVSTIQRMTVNLFGRDVIADLGDEEIDEEAEQEPIPIHAFDLIIADECHRGYTAKESAIWRQAMDHFDAIKIGLTATPAAHTTSYFKDVVYRYEYERAVREGYLVDYDVVTIKSNVRMQGVFLNEGEQVSFVDPETGLKQLDALEDERQYDTTEIEEKVTSPDSNRKILEEIKKFALEHEAEYGRFPKTLIFAANDLKHTSHADQLVDIARDVFGRGDAFVSKITGSPTVDRPLQRIREFRNRPEPGIVVTVDMLTTGVDIPDLEYIVFLRPVRSRILFEQMIGRGTRKGERHKDKSHFVVFDCFDGTLLEYFKNVTAITAEPPQKESRTFEEIIEAIWQNQDREYNTRCLIKRFRRIDKEMAAEGREQFAAFIPDGDMGAFAASLPRLLKEEFTKTMKLLRDKGFQDLLYSYTRKKRTFVIAHENVDEVSSEWRVRGADGKEYKPADYLAAFSEYVKENPAQIVYGAIRFTTLRAR
jgi:type I restriction enzyme R subunit